MYALFLLLILIMWIAFAYGFKKLFIEKNQMVSKWSLYSLIYFGIMLFFLLLEWPGAWSYDDYGVLINAVNMRLLPWQRG